METRFLGASGFRVPVLGFGAGTFGGRGPLFSAWGNTRGDAARRIVDLCLDAGVNLFDTADVYSDGESESILGAAIHGRRDRVIVSTKITLRTGPEPNAVGASRHHLIRATDAALRRLGTDYIDLLQLHHVDAMTAVEIVVDTLGDLVRAGKVRMVGASNYPGWQLMKSLTAADRRSAPRFVAHQAYYSLIGRDYEWELMPLAMDQQLGTIVWSPLGWGRLTGKLWRDQPLPPSARLRETRAFAPPVDDDRLFRVIDVLDAVAAETGKTVPQIAIRWLLQRPTVASVLIGARDEHQLRENLGAVGWQLSPEQRAARRRELGGAAVSPLPVLEWPVQRAHAAAGAGGHCAGFTGARGMCHLCACTARRRCSGGAVASSRAGMTSASAGRTCTSRAGSRGV